MTQAILCSGYLFLCASTVLADPPPTTQTTVVSVAAPATNPTTLPDDPQPADTLDELRVAADSKWGKDHDFDGASKAYDAAAKKYPKSVRLLVSMASISIDFAYQHAGSDAGNQAYSRARTAIDNALQLIDDGSGQDIDPGAGDTLRRMRGLIPSK